MLSRTDLYDDVVDVTSFSTRDVVEIGILVLVLLRTAQYSMKSSLSSPTVEVAHPQT